MNFLRVSYEFTISSHLILSGRGGSHSTEVTGGCCKACFKIAGEECGGIHDTKGICDNNLICTGQNGLPITEQGINKPAGICSKFN